MRTKVANLTDQRDLELIQALRAPSPEYAQLRRKMASLFQGRRCTVIGSAPDLGDVDLRDDDVVVCVNGAFHNAGRLGIARPHVAFLVSYIFTKGNRVAQKTYDLLRGREFDACVVVTGTLPLAACVTGFAEAGASYRSLDELASHPRAAIVGDVCGVELGFGRLEDRVSTGVTTAICAVWAGAKEVNLVGFSLEGGHSYMRFKSRRYHKKPDSSFFALCRERGLPVTSASPELRERFGIPARL